MGLTGLPSLDTLIEPLARGWIVEFYGYESGVRLVYHHVVAEAARHGRVAVVHIQEFGGLNPYLIARLARVRRSDPGNILVARGFRLRDVPRLIEEAFETGAETIVVVDPYLYAPRSWRLYDLLSSITGALRRASAKARIVVANRATKFNSGFLPEGGNYHHHSVHVIVRLDPSRRGLIASLLKHPGKRVPRRSLVHMAELVVAGRWVGQRPLLEYL